MENCTYTTPDQTVLAIVGGAVFCHHDIFMHEVGIAAGWERRQLFIDAEPKRPCCGWILKSTDANPNSVMPFFAKHRPASLSNGLPQHGFLAEHATSLPF